MLGSLSNSMNVVECFKYIFKTLYFMIRDYLPLLNFVRQLCTCLYINGFFVEEMVFCYQNCSNLLWERIVLVIEKKIEIWGWMPLWIFKIFGITRTICLNSERSEQFLVTECFFILFLEVSQIWWIRKIRIQIGKIIGI